MRYWVQLIGQTSVQFNKYVYGVCHLRVCLNNISRQDMEWFCHCVEEGYDLCTIFVRVNGVINGSDLSLKLSNDGFYCLKTDLNRQLYKINVHKSYSQMKTSNKGRGGNK